MQLKKCGESQDGGQLWSQWRSETVLLLEEQFRLVRSRV